MRGGLGAVRRSRGYHALVRLGLIGYGLVHLVIGWIAVQVAVGGTGEASTPGALDQLSQTPLGSVLVWVMAIGFFTLSAWQLIEAVVGRHTPWARMTPWRRIASAGRALVYAVVGGLAAAVAAGVAGSGGRGEETVSAALLRFDLGQALVAGLGVVIGVVGVSQIVRGVKQNFLDDLDQHAGRAARQLGRIGFCAKGLSLIIIGGLFAWAGLSDDPDHAGGLDAALAVIRAQPFGAVLLVLMAAGIGCFGLYCFVWSRSARY